MARVQSVSGQNTGSPTIAVTFGSTPTTGNIVVVGASEGITSGSPTIASVADGNSVALSAMVPNVSGTAGSGVLAARVFAYVVPATPSKTFTVTFTPTSGNGFSAIAVEYSGSTATADGTWGTTTVTTAGSGGATYSSSAAGELLYSYSGDLGLMNSETVPTGYSADANNINASSDANSLVGTKSSTGGSEANTWTLPNAGGDIYAVITGAFTNSGGADSSGLPTFLPQQELGPPIVGPPPLRAQILRTVPHPDTAPPPAAATNAWTPGLLYVHRLIRGSLYFRARVSYVPPAQVAVLESPTLAINPRRRGQWMRTRQLGNNFIGPQIIPPNPQLWWSVSPRRRGLLVRKERAYEFAPPQDFPIAVAAPARRWRGFLFRKGQSFLYPQTIPPAGPPVSGFVAWYDASKITGQADGTTLATWPDLSPSGFHLRATGAAQPTYYSSTLGKTVNGLPAVWFDGANNWMQSAVFGAPLAQPGTVFVVAQPVVLQASAVFDGGSTRQTIGIVTLNGNFYCGAGNTFTDGHSNINLQLFTAQFNGAASTFTVTGQSNGTSNAGANALPQITLSGAPAHVALWNGPICEVIYYHSALSVSDQQSVNTYLTNKWFNSWTPGLLPERLRFRVTESLPRRAKSSEAPITQAPAPPPTFPPNLNVTRRRGQWMRTRQLGRDFVGPQIVPPNPNIAWSISPRRRGLLVRKGNRFQPPVPQESPTTVTRPRLRGNLPRRGRTYDSPLTQAIPPPPSFVPNLNTTRRRGAWVRNRQLGRDFVGKQIVPPNPNIAWSVKPRLRGLLVRKGRSNEAPLPVPAPIPVSRPRLRGVPVRRGLTREVPLTQQPPPPPKYPPTNTRARLRGLVVRKFQSFFWWPNQAPPPPPPPTPTEFTAGQPIPYWVPGDGRTWWGAGDPDTVSRWEPGTPATGWTATQAILEPFDGEPDGGAPDWQTGEPRS